MVMHYRPITENHFLKFSYPVLPFPVGNCCWVFFVCLSRFGPSVVLKQVVQIHYVPKSFRVRYTALTDSKNSFKKDYGKCSRIAKFRRNLQDSDQKTCPNPQEILGIVLTDCKMSWTKTSLNCQEILGIGVHKFHKCLGTRGFGLNNCLKSQAILAVCSRTAKTPRCGLKTVRTFRHCRGCVPKLQNTLATCMICL